MGRYLGPGLLGLGVTAMIAGFMSGMAGNASAFATVFTYDVYRPLLNRNASDHHYLNMGRACSVLGILLSIGTAYMLFYFSNILEFLQVLIFFFIVPLFGVVILGMLWKRCTPAGGFWGFLIAILVSMSMWGYVHSFPAGRHPPPRIDIEKGAVVTLEKVTDSADERITKVIVESGKVRTVNVPIPGTAGSQPLTSGKLVVKNAAVPLPANYADPDKPQQTALRVLAPEIVLAGAEKGATDKFGVEGVPVVLKPGVEVAATAVVQYFNAAEFNTAHAKYIARSEKAKPMAVNMYSGFWTLVVCLLVAIVVSLFTTPKPDHELANLVYGLTPLPDEGRCPWYEHPLLWAGVVGAVLIAVNIIFW